MNRRQKGIITLLITLMMGFVLGFLAGRGCSNETVVELEREAVLEDEESGDDFPQASSKEEVKKGSGSKPKEIIYYRKRLPYSKLFNDLNEQPSPSYSSYSILAVPRCQRHHPQCLV